MQVGQGADLHNGQRPQFGHRGTEDEDNAWPPGEVSVRRTSERMWKDEMQSDTRGGHHALSFPDSGRQTGERQARVTKVLEEVKWRISILREVGGLSGAKSLEQGVYHGRGKMWFGAAEEADGLMRKLVDQSFLEFFTAGTGFGLLLIPTKAL